MKMIELQVSKAETGEEITKKDIEEAIGELEGIDVDTSAKNVEGEYKEYGFEIDENYNVIIKDKLIGSKPTGFAEVITKIGDLEEVDISVIGNLKDGEISSIEALNGAELKEKVSSSEYIFSVKDNDMYNFRIRGSNGRNITVSCTVENAIPLRDDLLTAVESVKTSGVRKFKIIGKENEEAIEEIEIYSLNVINYEGDLILDGKKQVEGSTITSNTYLFGSIADISNGNSYAKNTVVLKINGNLTINSGITLTTVLGSNGGPLGLLIYTTGQLTNNGLITMSERAAYSPGQNVYLYKKINNLFEFIPKNGGAGGIGGSGQAARGFYQGSPGNAGTNRACRWWSRRNLVYRKRNLVGTSSWNSVDKEKVMVVEQEELLLVLIGSGSWGNAPGTPLPGLTFQYWNYWDGSGYHPRTGLTRGGGLLICYGNIINGSGKWTSDGGMFHCRNVPLNVWNEGSAAGGGSVNLFAKTECNISKNQVQANGGVTMFSNVKGGNGSISAGLIKDNLFSNVW